jgi:hypothetical protein
MISYGLLTNPSNDILSEISKIYDLNFDYAELGIEGPEGNPQIINKKRNEISRLFQKLSEFYKARFLDCKINAYPNYTDDFRKRILDCTSYGGRGIVPNFLFIDIDKGAFNGNLDLLSKALIKVSWNL